MNKLIIAALAAVLVNLLSSVAFALETVPAGDRVVITACFGVQKELGGSAVPQVTQKEFPQDLMKEAQSFMAVWKDGLLKLGWSPTYRTFPDATCNGTTWDDNAVAVLLLFQAIKLEKADGARISVLVVSSNLKKEGRTHWMPYAPGEMLTGPEARAVAVVADAFAEKLSLRIRRLRGIAPSPAASGR